MPSLPVLPSESVFSSNPPFDCGPPPPTGCRMTAALRTGLPLSSLKTVNLIDDTCPELFFLSPANSKVGTKSVQTIATREPFIFIEVILGNRAGRRNSNRRQQA